MRVLCLSFWLICCAVSLSAYDFKACEKRAALSMEYVGGTYGIAIRSLESKAPSKAVLFVYSPRVSPKGYKVLKHDPFVGMYLLESKKNLEPIILRDITHEILEDEIASVTPNDSVSGKIETRMQSPIDYATLNTPTFQNSLISTVCDHVYGIGIGGDAFIEKVYLDRFLNSDPIYYGDIGIRVFQNEQGAVEVNVVEPFFPRNPFRYGDIILAINGQDAQTLPSFHRVVFDLKENSTANVKINRNGSIMEVPVIVDRRRGGMLLRDDFLARVHIGIDDNFTITSVGAGAKDGFERLRVGDKILRVNQRDVPKGYNAIIRLLGEYPDMRQQWLISRNDFQFFINVNEKAQNSSIDLTKGLLNEDTRFSF